MRQRALSESTASDISEIYVLPQTKKKDTIYTEHKAIEMIINILNNNPMGLKRYQLLAELQRKNKKTKWSESFGVNIGEFNDFVKSHKKLKILDPFERNFGIITKQRYSEMMRYRHQLYESTDDECECDRNV